MKGFIDKSKTSNNIITVFVMVLICLIILVNPIIAKEKEITVKVGFFELPGFNEYDSLGNPIGYNVDYLSRIAEHTGWKYEFVKANSWSEALEMLENHKIDMISPARKTPERIEKFAFSKQELGMEYGALLTLQTNDELTFEDFPHFSNIKIGCVKTHVMKNDFFEYAKQNGFTPNVNYYKDMDELLSALNVGEVDAIVANLMNAKQNLKVLGRFSPDVFYYMLNKEDKFLLKKLDEVMTHLKVTHSQLEQELTDKYYEYYNVAAFTKEELNYIANAPELTVGYISDWDPISYIDVKSGEAVGITRDIIDKISEISGLRFKYIPFPKGKITYEYLKKNNIMLVSSMERNGINNTVEEIVITDSYLNTEKIIVGKYAELDKSRPFRIALSTGSQTLESVIKQKYPKADILLYDSIEECFDAVLSGEAEVLMQNKYAVERYLYKPKYENLIVIPSEIVEDDLSLGIIIGSQEGNERIEFLSDERLISIIDKSIGQISKMDISEITIRHTISNPYKFNFNDLYERFQYFIIALSISIIIVIIITIHIFRIRKKNMEILKESESKLMNITNTINGGVVVLLPYKGLEIAFANEGFLSMIQYTKEEYNVLKCNRFIKYLHIEDVNVLNAIIANREIGDHISVRLSLFRKDGTYIPILFNGTLSMSHGEQKELYCVIMDISEQLSMMEKLEQEQERYQFLIEKSNDMILDIDLETKEISAANNFIKRFGWAIPVYLEKITVESISSLWNVFEEDRETLLNSIKLVFIDNIESECQIRLKKEEHSYIWCSVLHNIMKKNGKSIRIIVKVTDIDKEVKEKEKLLKKAQTDTLTGLYNKETFHKLGKEYFKQCTRESSAVIFIDLDNFKKVNDLLGHMTGDKAIKDAAQKLQLIFSQNDVIARFGGDEFCVLVKEIPLDTLCDKLIWVVDKMKEVYNSQKYSVAVTTSVGVALSSAKENDFENLVHNADQALYSAKENGKNQFIIYGEGMELEGYKGRN